MRTIGKSRLSNQKPFIKTSNKSITAHFSTLEHSLHKLFIKFRTIFRDTIRMKKRMKKGPESRKRLSYADHSRNFNSGLVQIKIRCGQVVGVVWLYCDSNSRQCLWVSLHITPLNRRGDRRVKFFDVKAKCYVVMFRNAIYFVDVYK